VVTEDLLPYRQPFGGAERRVAFSLPQYGGQAFALDAVKV